MAVFYTQNAGLALFYTDYESIDPVSYTHLLESAVGLPMNKETSHVMLCGNPQMVRDTQQLLKETRQMTKHLRRRPGHMTAEHYW